MYAKLHTHNYNCIGGNCIIQLVGHDYLSIEDYFVVFSVVLFEVNGGMNL